MVHSVASLAMQQVGVPQTHVQGMFKTIQQLVKHVQTAFGDSAITYVGDEVPKDFCLHHKGCIRAIGTDLLPGLLSV